ncbi:MerR family transcriptional regulator [Maledivibacter halophilus]|uniref:DNA-binding transcriptional regulator, MerR family n=1 Tax=Maledivibacter halophilus TaxID=36842 RepID=A0A1T5IUZ5_9FIRM|nr:MerR family transcriptional regulator [Maledivibacter halophilus]SKC42788.1 DNA-binding transcriptional regulator, MerR family [Maledivibacter halophilus]
MERLSIGQMAELNHISKQTLRYYDKIKLLEPYFTDEETGYRYYDIRQSARLDIIQYMKSLGMKLKDIKKQLDRNDPSLIKSVLRQKMYQIDEQICELECQKRAVRRTLMCYERYEASPRDGTIVLEYIEDRSMYCIDAGINFYGHGIEVYEKMLRKLKESLIDDKLPQVYFCNAGTILRQKNLEQLNFYSSEVFVFVDKDYVPDDLTVSIPANTYLCIYCDKFEKEKKYIYRLLDAIKENNYTIVGDYICEVLVELPFLAKNERGMFLRLQIPIRLY